MYSFSYSIDVLAVTHEQCPRLPAGTVPKRWHARQVRLPLPACPPSAASCFRCSRDKTYVRKYAAAHGPYVPGRSAERDRGEGTCAIRVRIAPSRTAWPTDYLGLSRWSLTGPLACRLLRAASGREQFGLGPSLPSRAVSPRPASSCFVFLPGKGVGRTESQVQFRVALAACDETPNAFAPPRTFWNSSVLDAVASCAAEAVIYCRFSCNGMSVVTCPGNQDYHSHVRFSSIRIPLFFPREEKPSQFDFFRFIFFVIYLDIRGSSFYSWVCSQRITRSFWPHVIHCTCGIIILDLLIP